VMRDGRMAYDGAPLADHAVHGPIYGETHTHHHASHHDHDHVPVVRSPFEGGR
jgi:zinc transport system ATP-binding protein